ncbi:MAG: hypothetical protein O3A20_09710 [Planctomycetota bacterium]|nr:hypothetical protein [Planctomycetota bacterium]
MLKSVTLGVALLASAPLLGQGYGPNWFEDFDAAVAAAKEQNKDLLVDFTGSDW